MYIKVSPKGQALEEKLGKHKQFYPDYGPLNIF